MISRLFGESTETRTQQFYSKLALLELCGWIEESMDDVVRTCANRKLKTSGNLEFVEKQIIRGTHGFEYKRHFRTMLIQLIGLVNLERLEKSLDIIKFHGLASTLDTLKTCRDAQAHTHLKGTMITLDHPSVTIDRFKKVYEGLKDIEKNLKTLRI